MNGFIRYLICFCAAFAAFYLSGFGSLMGGLSDSLAVSILVRASLVLGGIGFLIWHGYAFFTKKNAELSSRIMILEEEIARLKDNKEQTE